MRILIIGPRHDSGSLPPYLDALTAGLTSVGVHVDRIGSTGTPYDTATDRFWDADRILATADRLLGDVDFTAYDLLSVHFGNLEIEQLLPARWAGLDRPPTVYHAHSLDWTLFTQHVPDRPLRAAVEDGVAAMDGYVFFGQYAQQQLTSVVRGRPSAVTWLPTTIPPDAAASRRRALFTFDQRPVLSLYGYAAPWKDIPTLLRALEQVTIPFRFVLAGPFWDQPEQAGVDLTAAISVPIRIGAADLTLIPSYLDSRDRRNLVAATDLAVFPYRAHTTFQGSGAIADYLAHSTPCVTADIANMRELVGDSGLTVPAQNPVALAHAINRFLTDAPLRQQLAQAAAQRAPLFTAERHAATCLRLYQHVLDQRPHGAPQWPRPNCSSHGTAMPTATATRSSADP